MPTATLSSDLLTREQAATLLGVKSQTLAVWATAHRYNLPFIKIGRNKVRYRLADLEKWMADRTVTGTGQLDSQQE
jgi:excisionase family DNA binding protein